MIRVVDDNVTAVLVGGEWTRVRDVVVGYAEFTANGSSWGVGLYLSAVIQGGPNNGDHLVAPVRSVEAFRTVGP